MGQQQLLLIVLGILIIGAAIAVGINLFSSTSKSANIDMMVNDMANIAANAQRHYIRPVSIGGGHGSFDGYEIPDRIKYTENGSYEVTTIDNGIEVVGRSELFGDVVVVLELTISDEWHYEWRWEHD